jgi:hypothetical protein
MTVSFLRGDGFFDRRNHSCHGASAQTVPHARRNDRREFADNGIVEPTSVPAGAQLPAR